MAKKAKIKNISKCNFILSLDTVNRGKRFDMKPDAAVFVDEDELNYLMTECQGAFKKGYLEVVSKDADIEVEVIETENKMSDEEIEELLNSPFTKIKSQVNKITASHLLKEIRAKAEELNKSNKTIEIIDSRIAEVADSLVL
jgi:hypothetical protein